MRVVLDAEFDNLLEELTKMHCLVYKDLDSGKIVQLTDYQQIKEFFLNNKLVIIGHNITTYDIPAIEKVLNIKIKAKLYDTLAFSWYLYPQLTKHGLEEWGEFFGVKKPEIKDWKGLTKEEYLHRCTEDVKINTLLWEKIVKELTDLYEGDKKEANRLMEYLQYKMDCVREQEEVRIKLDIPHVQEVLAELKKEKEAKTKALEAAMPQVPVIAKKVYKDVIIVDGNVIKRGDLEFDYYYQQGFNLIKEHIVETIRKYVAPNANSVPQKKAWLDSLGWKPDNIKQVKNKKTGVVKNVPQMSSKKDDGEICPSIKALYKKEANLEHLEGLTILGHRIGVLEGFLRDQIDGYIKPSMAGFTNTLRLKHKGLANLVGVDKKYGNEIRGSFIAEDGGLLVNSDMSSLEDTTKQHYMYFYDPQYVKEMRVPGFDPHIDISVRSNIMTQEEADFYINFNKEKATKEDKKRYAEIKEKRFKGKTTNFSSIYGIGAEKLARELDITVKEAKSLLEGYWKRNSSVKKVAEACRVKTVGTQKWLYNPISRFWYSLRAEKDRFSTLNQGSGVYCFDNYVEEVRKSGIRIAFQYHDEIAFKCLPGEEEMVKSKLNEAIRVVNEKIKLNVPLGISIEFGTKYSETH